MISDIQPARASFVDYIAQAEEREPGSLALEAKEYLVSQMHNLESENAILQITVSDLRELLSKVIKQHAEDQARLCRQLNNLKKEKSKIQSAMNTVREVTSHFDDIYAFWSEFAEPR